MPARAGGRTPNARFSCCVVPPGGWPNAGKRSFESSTVRTFGCTPWPVKGAWRLFSSAVLTAGGHEHCPETTVRPFGSSNVRGFGTPGRRGMNPRPTPGTVRDVGTDFTSVRAESQTPFSSWVVPSQGTSFFGRCHTRTSMVNRHHAEVFDRPRAA